MILDLSLFGSEITSIFEKNIERLRQEKFDQDKIDFNRKKMNFQTTLDFLSRSGFEISKSTLYKLTSARQIPFYKFGKKLVFQTDELQSWIDAKLSSPKTDYSYSELVSKSAIKKLNR